MGTHKLTIEELESVISFKKIKNWVITEHYNKNGDLRIL